MTTDISTLGIAVDSSQVKRASADLDNLTAAGGRAEKASTSLAGSATILTRVYRDLAGAFAAIGVSRFIAETTALNQRYQELGIVLGVVAKNAGLTRKEVDSVTESVRKQGISMIESRSVVTRLIQAQIDLSKASQLARLAQDAAVVGQINSSEALDRMIHGITSAQVEVLRGIGINVNFEQSYKKMAQEIGVSTSSLSEYQKMQARTNVVLAEAEKLNGVYAASMENAGKQMRSTQRLAEDLKVKIGGLFDQAAMIGVKGYTDLLKDLDRVIEDMAKSGELKDWSHRIAIEFAGLMDLTRVFIGQFGILGNLLATQFTNLKNGDFDKVTTSFARADEALRALYQDGEKYQDQVNSRVIQESMLAPISERQVEANKKNVAELDALNKKMEDGAVLSKKFADPLKVLREEQARLKDLLNAGAISQQIYNKALKDAQDQYAKPQIKAHNDAVRDLNKAQQESLRIESEYIKLLEIERRQRQDLLKPYQDSAKQAASRVEDMQDEISAMRLVRDQQISLQAAVQKTAIAKLEEKRISATDSGIAAQLDAEIAARRKLLGMIPEQERLAKETQRTTNEVTELWKQAGRNIQSTLANSIFNFFDDGLKGMVKNVVAAVGRIASEFAALRLSQAIGLGSLFGVSGAASAAGSSGSGIGALDIAGMGSNAMTLFRGGFGATGLIGEGLGGLGALTGSANLAAFGGGFAGDALGGLAAGGFTSGAAGAASMGASFAAFAGPAIALAAVDAIGRLFGGNKTLGGAEMIPVIGGFLAGLFGHGPMKFRQQSLQGTVSSGGFDGDITNVFRAKGGLLVGNKHDPRQQDIPHQLQDMLDTTIDGFYKSAHGFAENLGLDVNLVDHFTQELQIKSEKGKKLTDEAIQQMLAGIGDSIATNLIPSIADLEKAGESAFTTLTRLNNEFGALVTSATLLGSSVANAKAYVGGSSFEGRSAFVAAAGGIDALVNKAQYFADNFLTDAERLAPKQELLNFELTKLGLSTDLTKEQFKDLVQSFGSVNGISEEMLQTLLILAPAYIQVRDATEAVTKAQEDAAKAARDRLKAEQMTALGSAFTDLQKSVDAQRKSATQKYNDAVKESDKRIQDVTTSIGKLKTLSDSLKSSVEKLRPLSREDAKFQLLGAINGAKRGIFPEQGSLDRALGVLTDSNSITGARSSFEFAREQAKTANMIADLGDLTDDQLTVEQRSLAQLERQRKALDRGFSDEMTRLDSLVDSAQKQIDSLNGINTAILTLSKAIGEFNRASTQAGGGVIGGGNISGNAGISDQQIRDFVKTPGLSEMDIYNAAKKHGVSFEQYARARGIDVNALYKWADAHGLPRFADGGFHSGGLRIVGERGPELEFTGPSRIASNNDLKEALSGNKEVVIELRLLRAAVEKNNRYSRGVFKDISAVTQGGTSFRTTAA